MCERIETRKQGPLPLAADGACRLNDRHAAGANGDPVAAPARARASCSPGGSSSSARSRSRSSARSSCSRARSWACRRMQALAITLSMALVGEHGLALPALVAHRAHGRGRGRGRARCGAPRGRRRRAAHASRAHAAARGTEARGAGPRPGIQGPARSACRSGSTPRASRSSSSRTTTRSRGCRTARRSRSAWRARSPRRRARAARTRCSTSTWITSTASTIPSATSRATSSCGASRPIMQSSLRDGETPRAHRRRRVRGAARELQRGVRTRRGHAAARRRAGVAVPVEGQGLPGRRVRGRGRHHAPRAQPLGGPLGSRHGVLHCEGAGPQPRLRVPRRERLAIHAPDEPRVVEAHQRRAHRGRLHAALPADRAHRRAATSRA